MAAIVNLYVLAPPAAPPDALAAMARALLQGGFLAPPASACAPLRDRPAVPGLRTPQGVALLAPDRVRTLETAAALEAELGRALAAAEPILVGFLALAPAHPDVGNDVGGEQALGGDCAVGLYAFPAGHRLRVTGEGGGAGVDALLDETETAWVHLQGEAAPRAAAFEGSALARAMRAAWPGARVLEVTWG